MPDEPFTFSKFANVSLPRPVAVPVVRFAFTATAPANTTVSTPPAPFIVSLPSAPTIELLLAFPVSVSLPGEPVRFSTFANVSLPGPLATPVVKFATTAAVFSNDTVSVPAPPSMVSLPVPAQIVSLPARPLMTSLPPPLSITSLPVVPVSV